MKKKIIFFLALCVAFQTKPMMTGAGGEDVGVTPSLDLTLTTSPELITVEQTVTDIADLTQPQVLDVVQTAVSQIPEQGEHQALLDVVTTISSEPQELAKAATQLQYKFLNAIRNGINENIAPAALAAVKLLFKKAQEHSVAENYAQAYAVIASLVDLKAIVDDLNLATGVRTELNNILNEAGKYYVKNIQPNVTLNDVTAVQTATQPIQDAQRNLLGTEGTGVTHPWSETDTRKKPRAVTSPEPKPSLPPETNTWDA